MGFLVFRRVVLCDSLKATFVEKLLFFSFCWEHAFSPFFYGLPQFSLKPIRLRVIWLCVIRLTSYFFPTICTTWTITKRLEKKLDGNYTRILRAILNKSWWQHPTRHRLYGHLPPITKTIQVRRTRHAGHCWRSDVLLDPHIWPSKSKTTSSNLHTAAMWGHRM